MARVAIGGFLHETNTFAPTKADYDAFMHGGGRASIDDAASVLTTMRGINAGQAGFIAVADANGWDIVPTIACAASPSARRRRAPRRSASLGPRAAGIDG